MTPTSDDGGQFAWLARLAEDELTPRAAELVAQTGKASTSMMQTKLKVGFNRASRLMDELERFGIVGPQDPRNPAVPRTVYGPTIGCEAPRMPTAVAPMDPMPGAGDWVRGAAGPGPAVTMSGRRLRDLR